jgi:hypothetical protein
MKEAFRYAKKIMSNNDKEKAEIEIKSNASATKRI